MELSRRAARTHLVASRHPKYFLRRHSAGSVSPGSGRPVRHHRLRPGALPQTLQTPPHGGRPVLRSRPRPHDAKQRSSRRSLLPRPARHYPRLWLRTPLGVGPAGLSPASSMRRPAHTTAASDAHPARHPLPEVIGYRARRSGGNSQATGPGRASPVPAATIWTFHAPYAGGSLTAALPGSSPRPWPSP